jgi:hypothetical protein
MKFSEVIPNKIYTSRLTEPFSYQQFLPNIPRPNISRKLQIIYTNCLKESPVNFLFFTLSNSIDSLQHTITYEILGSTADVSRVLFPFNMKVKEISIDDLPLYLDLKYRTPNFDNLLKGTPIDSETPSISSILRLNPPPKPIQIESREPEPDELLP